MKKILIVNPFGIGDVLFTTPFIAALKEEYPRSVICYIGNARTVTFLRNDPRLDKVFSYERDEFIAVYSRAPWAFFCKWWSFVKELRREGFDTAFDLSLGSPLALALFFAGIPRRIGFDFKGRGRWLTDRVPLIGYEGHHVAEYYLGLLKDVGRKPRSGFGLSMTLSALDQAFAVDFMAAHSLTSGGFVVIHPGGGESWGKSAGLKRWSAVNFAKLADKIVEIGGRPIILVVGKNEVALCEEVAQLMRNKSIILCGQSSLTQIAAIMQRARLVITNDGGPLHVAVAVHAKTASLFGPVDPEVYGPYPRDGHIVVQKHLPCQPCYRHFRMTDCQHQSCLKDLAPDDVFEQLRRAL